MSQVAKIERLSATLPLGQGVELLTRDANGLLALGKPAGVLSHPNDKGDQARSLLDCAYSLERESYEWTLPGGGQGRLWLLNRLDSATSGVLLGALDEALADTIRTQFKNRRIHKVYNALVFGVPSVPQQVWRDRLAVEKSHGQIRSRAAGHIPCESHMRLLARGRGGSQALSLLQLEPKTGRSHQLRVQCTQRRLAIVGDATYGDFAANRIFAKEQGTKRLFLHSLETSFEYDFGDARHRFRARCPLPEAFEKALQGKVRS